MPAGERAQVGRLVRKGEDGGFAVPGGWGDGPEGGRLLAVRFDGLLAVTFPDRFAAAVAAGVGAGNGLGFGLRSVAPAGPM